MSKLEITDVEVDGIKTKVSNRFIYMSCGPYVVYDDKIWKTVQKERKNYELHLGLVREASAEKATVTSDKVLFIIEPSGYIHC